jgi:3-oxosteroid 1-dehydrogenase
MGQMVGYQTTLAPGWETMFPTPPAQSMTGKPHAILVDQSGVRYMNEGGSYELYCKTMLKRNQTVSAVPSWAVFDHVYIEQYMLAGTMPGASKPEAWTQQGYLKKADSIEDLARLIAVEPATLKGTVDRWNGFVDNGVDEDFHRGERAYDDWLGDPYHGSNKALGKIETGPFYAVNVVPGDVSTSGGALTDAHGRVVRADGTPIEGLYATGVSTASVMGNVYPGAGASIGPSLTFGYIAAKHAAGVGNQL